MANNTQFDPQNPDALFSPDQWLNQFSRFNNAALPWPSSYAGTPTDAMGNPIQSFANATNAAQQQYQQQLAAFNAQPRAAPAQGTTLNTNPLGGSPWSPGGYGLGMNGANPQIPLPGTPNGSGGASYFPQASLPWPGQMQPQQQAQAPAAPTPPNNWQAAIAALANPGKVTTPGATVPATASAQPGPGSVQAFLQNWKPAQSGPGSGFQQGFAGALKGMGY